ncbi:hypothetical protein Angca_002006, partial [Angiostrongylus cantonensis]
ITVVLIAGFLALAARAQTDGGTSQPICSVNQLFNGQICTCAPGYFSSSNDESKSRCEDECEEVYFSFFTYGKCVGDIFGNLPKDQQPACNLRCGVRPRLWASIGLFCVFAAACATLLFTIPMCIATCASCLHAKKVQASYKILSHISTNITIDKSISNSATSPYAYWPYYGRA